MWFRKNNSTISTTINQNVQIVMAQEHWNVIMRRKMKFQINKRYFIKKRAKILLQKQNKTNIQIKDSVRSYDELENSLKALQDYFSINDSESNQIFC